jgi:threonine synthase
LRYISTRGRAPVLDFSDVLLVGLADDGGLYVPETWPTIAPAEIASYAGRTYAEVAVEIMARFTEPAISKQELTPLVEAAYADFGHPAIAPLRQLDAGEWLLELFHGPTLSFKDYALQVVGQLFDHVLKRRQLHMTVVGATSGDTGSAAIEACRDRDAITAFILHPKGRITDVQRRQMTTVASPNVHNLAIEGTFDDCQALVKQMFGDAAFRDRMRLTAVNSINWARVMAQVVYYFTAAAALGAPSRVPAFAVPTGNFGDAFAGHVARRMGLAIPQMVIATNRNDILVRLLESGTYRKGPVLSSISPSIDIQVSSNFERLLLELEGNDPAAVRQRMAEMDQSGQFRISDTALARMRTQFEGRGVSEEETLRCMAEVQQRSGIIIDPHTAVGIVAGRAKRRQREVPMVYLSTAHAAKFPEAVQQASGMDAPLPVRLADLYERKERFEVLPNDFGIVKAYVEQRAAA